MGDNRNQPYKNITASQALALLRPAAERLAELHRSGRVHGRICPETVMVRRRVFFCFSLPETMRGGEENDQRFFTVLSEPEETSVPAEDGRGRGYIPLEQCLKEERTVPASDVYSLCAVFYHLLTGCEPTDIEARLRGEKLPLPSALGADAPKWQEAVLMKGLSEMEKDRYPDAVKLCQALYDENGYERKTAFSADKAGDGEAHKQETGNPTRRKETAAALPATGSGNTIRPGWRNALAKYVKKIHKIEFRNAAVSLPLRKWDISVRGDGSVIAWLENEGNLLDGAYTLCICGKGEGVDAPANSEGLFAGFENLETIDFHRIFLTYHTVSMKRLFDGDKMLRHIHGLDSLDTSRVTSMSQMFSDCWSLGTLDLSSFDTSQVTDMSAMFQNCVSMTELDVSGFDTANVTDMSYMFYHCRQMEKLDLSGFDMSRVKSRERMLTGTRWE